MKPHITNMATTAIIYRESNKKCLFLERKDDTHPIKLARGALCTPGGNWIGASAIHDTCPFDTLAREIEEEWNLSRNERDSAELQHLGLVNTTETFAPTPISPNTPITQTDREMLQEIKRAVVTAARPYGDFINVIDSSALKRADPSRNYSTFSVLVSYFTAALDEETWKKIEVLQSKFGNISAESISTITSLDDIVHEQMHVAFGHDQVLRHFFRSNGYAQQANQMVIVPDILSLQVGMPREHYTEYLAEMEIMRKP